MIFHVIINFIIAHHRSMQCCLQIAFRSTCPGESSMWIGIDII